MLDDQDLYAPSMDPVAVRRTVGMVFQRPNPFPTMSIRDNVAAGLKLNGMKGKKQLDEVVERSLQGRQPLERGQGPARQARRRASPAASSSGCASPGRSPSSPQVLLMDEPCSALDPISTLAIEDLINELKADYTIVIVTHNMQQAARVSDQTAFFNLKADRRAGPAGRGRRHPADLQQPHRAGHRGLHLRPLRLITSPPRPIADPPPWTRTSPTSCDLPSASGPAPPQLLADLPALLDPDHGEDSQ